MTQAEFQATIARELKKGRHILITGPRGSGKTHTLRTLAEQQAAGGSSPAPPLPHSPALYFPRLPNRRALLLDILQHLWQNGGLADFAYYVDWADVKHRLGRLSVPELLDLAAAALPAHPTLLLIDNLTDTTDKTIADLILPLMRVCQTIVAAEVESASQRKRVNLVADKCKRLEIPTLTKDEATALLWATLPGGREQYDHWRLIETRILQQAAGRPGVLLDLAQQIRAGGALTDVRELTASGAARVNLVLPVALALIACIFAARYIARGFDDPTLYLIAGLGSGFSIFLRPFLHRMNN